MIYKSLLSSVCLIILFVACSVRESWPPKTTGPILPVRYCDINKEDKNKTIIGYALVDTSAVIGFVLMMAGMVFGALCWTWKMG